MSLDTLTDVATQATSDTVVQLRFGSDATVDAYKSWSVYSDPEMELISSSVTLKGKREPANEAFSVSAIRRVIGRNFADLEEVESVFAISSKQRVKVLVLLTHDEYDDPLMDTLLDREIIILDSFPDMLLDFEYIPLLGRAPEELVPAVASQL